MKTSLKILFDYAVARLLSRPSTARRLLRTSFMELVGDFYEHNPVKGMKLLNVPEDEFYNIYEHYWDYVVRHISSVKFRIGK